MRVLTQQRPQRVLGRVSARLARQGDQFADLLAHGLIRERIFKLEQLVHRGGQRPRNGTQQRHVRAGGVRFTQLRMYVYLVDFPDKAVVNLNLLASAGRLRP